MDADAVCKEDTGRNTMYAFRSIDELRKLEALVDEGVVRQQPAADSSHVRSVVWKQQLWGDYPA